MRTILRFVVAAACLSLLARPAFGQDKPKLLEINGFMFKGVFTELDPEQMKRRLSLAEIEKLHLDGKFNGRRRYPEAHGHAPKSCAAGSPSRSRCAARSPSH